MVTSKYSKAFYFCLFLLPALVLYAFFFIVPLVQGIQYSFTDWNGIVPEIPFAMEKGEFERNVLLKLAHAEDRALLNKFYRLNADGGTYLLQNWLEVRGGRHRQITPGEKQAIKRVLRSVGISSIKQIGWENYREMFQSDERFMPRMQKTYLFNEFDDLPETIAARTFQKNLLPHLKSDERKLVLTYYSLNSKRTAYRLEPPPSEDIVAQLQSLLAEKLYQYTLVWGVLGFTLFFTFFNVILANLLALVLALALDQKLKARNCLRAIFFLPNVLSLVIVAFIWSFVFRLILPVITGISSWFEPHLAPYTVVIVSVWQSCGYLMIIYLAGLQAIPDDIQEAAQIDGAQSWQRLRFVTLPLLVPAITICLFYSLSNSLKTFEVAMALTNGGPAYVTTPIVLDIYNNAFLQNRFGYGTAKAVFLCLIIMVVTGVQLTLLKRREVEL